MKINHWNKSIPRSYADPDPTHGHKKIGSQIYYGKSLSGKRAQKAALLTKVGGVAAGTLLIIPIPIMVKKGLYSKGRIWVREVFYNQKLSVIHQKAEEMTVLPKKSESNSRSRSQEALAISDGNIADALPLMLKSVDSVNNRDLVYYINTMRQVSKGFRNLMDQKVVWDLFNLGRLSFSNVPFENESVVDFILKAKNKLTLLHLPETIIHQGRYECYHTEDVKWTEDLICKAIDAQAHLQTLCIPSSHSLSLPLLSSLKNLKKLRSLQIALDDEELKELVKSLPALEGVNLSGRTTGASIETLAGLKRLKSLKIEKILSVEQVQSLVANHLNLEELIIKYPISNDGVAELIKLKHLKRLEIHGSMLQDGLPSFQSMPLLEHIQLTCAYGLTNLDFLIGLKKVISLELNGLHELVDLSFLDKFENLKSLSLIELDRLNGMPFQMKSIENLKILHCGNLQLFTCSEMVLLRSLIIAGCKNLKIKGSFEKLESLAELYLSEISSIEAPATITSSLKFLSLISTNQIEFPFHHFNQLESLEVMEFNIETLTLDDNFSKLRSLHLSGSKDQRIKGSFKSLLSLQNLHINYLDTSHIDLPSSIKNVRLMNVVKLESLNCQDLVNLERLELMDMASFKLTGVSGLQSLSYLKALMDVKDKFQVEGPLESLRSIKFVQISRGIAGGLLTEEEQKIKSFIEARGAVFQSHLDKA